MHLHLFKKNPNQSLSKKMINKYVNMLDVVFKQGPWRKKKHDINIFFFLIFFEKKQTKAKFDLFKKLWNE